jgi:hypothetical protein
MKSKGIRNFVWMMTAAGWRRGEILELADTLRRISYAELHDLISFAIHRQEDFGASFDGSEAKRRGDPSFSVSISTDIDDKVVRLLRDEAHLSAAEAVHSMSAGLRKIDRVRAANLPRYSKRSASPAAWSFCARRWSEAQTGSCGRARSRARARASSPRSPRPTV